jgi:hypothetical protein
MEMRETDGRCGEADNSIKIEMMESFCEIRTDRVGE